MDALRAGRVPRLGLVMAMLAGGAAVLTAAVAPLVGVYRVPLLHAVVGATLLGGSVGVFMRYSCRSFNQHQSKVRRWGPLMLAWLLAAMVLGYVCGFIAHLHLIGVYPMRRLLTWGWMGTPIAALSSVLTFPVCMWVVRRAERAARARHGSLVADSDRRSIFAALMSGLSLLALLVWPFVADGANNGELASQLVPCLAAGTLLVMGVLYGLARYDCYRMEWIVSRVESLDELDQHLEQDADEEGALPLTDLGLGDELYGAAPQGGSYRSGAGAVPEVAGFVEEVQVVLKRARRAVGAQLAFTVSVVGFIGLTLV